MKRYILAPAPFFASAPRDSFDFTDSSMSSSTEALPMDVPYLSAPIHMPMEHVEFNSNWDEWAGHEQSGSWLCPRLSFSSAPGLETSSLRFSFSFTEGSRNSISLPNLPLLPRDSSPIVEPQSEDSTLDSNGRDLSSAGEASTGKPARRRTPKSQSELLHTCPVGQCAKTYRRKGDLKFHVIHKHPSYVALPTAISKPKSEKEGKTYPCPVLDCKCGFKWHRDLRRHFKSKHPELTDQLEAIEGQGREREEAERDVHFDHKFEAQWRVFSSTPLDPVQ